MSAVGVYGPTLVFSGNVPSPIVLASTPVTVKNLDGSAATLYTDRTGSTTTSNIISTDSMGMLTFYAAPGSYLIQYTNRIGAQSLTVEVNPTAPTDSATYVPYDQTQTRLVPAGATQTWINNKNFKAVTESYAHGYSGGLIGLAYNDLAANTVAFPVGITGVGRVDNDGTAVFGAYILAETYNTTHNGGCAAEVDSFNYGAAPPSSYSYPPNRGFGGDFVPTGLTLGAGGTYDSFMALSINREGSSPRKWVTGIYVDPNAIRDYPMLIQGGSAAFPSTVTGNATYRGFVNVAASFGVGYADDAVGAQLLAGAINGTAPFIGASLSQGAATSLHFVTNNSVRVKLLGTGNLDMQTGTALSVNGTQVVTARQTGWTAATGTATRSTFATSTVTLSVLAEHVKALIDDLTSHGLIGT